MEPSIADIVRHPDQYTAEERLRALDKLTEWTDQELESLSTPELS